MLGYSKAPKGLPQKLNFEFMAATKESYRNAIIDVLIVMGEKFTDSQFLEIVNKLLPDFSSASLGLLKSLSKDNKNYISRRLYKIKTS